jgi:hypothetical protein
MWLAAVAAGSAFNLLCTGMVTTEGGSAREPAPYRMVYRIDLASGRYCDGDCRLTRALFEVQPARITIDQQGNPRPRASDYSINVIERDSGDQTILTASGRAGVRVYVKSTGRCERQPFTGFPAAVTRF